MSELDALKAQVAQLERERDEANERAKEALEQAAWEIAKERALLRNQREPARLLVHTPSPIGWVAREELRKLGLGEPWVYLCRTRPEVDAVAVYVEPRA